MTGEKKNVWNRRTVDYLEYRCPDFMERKITMITNIKGMQNGAVLNVKEFRFHDGSRLLAESFFTT